MYRKAYLRTLAAEVGLDPDAIGAEYDLLHKPLVASPTEPDVAAKVPDRWIKELVPSPRRNIVTLTVLAIVSAWFVLRPDPLPVRSRQQVNGSESGSLVLRTSVETQRAIGAPDQQSAADLVATATAMASRETPLKVDLATTGWCWVVAESDGERVLYGLIEPGERIVLGAQRKISLRLGDAGSVTLSVNEGPHYTPGLDGEVVELEVTPEDVERLGDGAADSGSAMFRRSDFTS
jgi:hypothetical protein